MIVAELMAFLQTCPQDHRVMVRSYELGIQDLEAKNCSCTYAKLGEWAGMEPTCGPHEQQDTKEGWAGLEEDPPAVVIPIVLLGRS